MWKELELAASSNVAQALYNPGNKQLLVQYHKNGTLTNGYVFFDVSLAEAVELECAISVGATMRRIVKDKVFMILEVKSA